MGGNILWMPSDVTKIIEEIQILSEREANVAEYEKALKPLIKQAALNEQSHIIHMLVDGGMSIEEVAHRLNRTNVFVNSAKGNRKTD